MATLYVSTISRTIVSVLIEGKLRAPHKLFLYRDPGLCVIDSDCSDVQNFILVLKIANNDFLKQPKIFDAENKRFILNTINPAWIKEIVVYSEQSRKIVAKLFQNNCPVEIKINSNFYTHIEPISPTKKIAHRIRIPATQQIQSPRPMPSIFRLTTRNEHVDLLKKAFAIARHSILITSYGINAGFFANYNLFESIRLAHIRGVNIYIYFNDINYIADSLANFLAQNEVCFDEAYTHSKILIVDYQFIAIGSFNWLSDISANDCNGTIVYSGINCNDLKEKLWQHMRYYRNLQYGNLRRRRHFKTNPINALPVQYLLEGNSSLTYIATLEQHRQFLTNIFLEARNRIIICSPFISFNREFQKDISTNILKNTSRRGVKVIFVCAVDDENLISIRNFIYSLRLTNIYLLPLANFHLKTIIVDNNCLAEGSFNWLSATRSEASQSHNHEVTFVVKGNIATNLIAHFFDSRIGREITQKLHQTFSTAQIPARRRKRKQPSEASTSKSIVPTHSFFQPRPKRNIKSTNSTTSLCTIL